jgi:hypothetical protein
MIEIIFDPVSRILSWSGSELVSCSILDDKRKLFDDAKLMLALATATVALEQRKFDIRSAARDLLESPASLFSALKVLGRDGVRDSLDNYVELSDSMNRSG